MFIYEDPLFDAAHILHTSVNVASAPPVSGCQWLLQPSQQRVCYLIFAVVFVCLSFHETFLCILFYIHCDYFLKNFHYEMMEH